jgi:predicted Zn finger-like uncharacterized protein
MTVSCPDCKSVFRVDPAKVPATGVRARCSVCGGVIAIAGGTLPVSVTPASSAAAVAPLGAGRSRPTPASIAPAGSSVPGAERVLTPPAPAALPFARSANHPAATLTPISSSATATPSAGKRPINPFLRADPAQRARRLARALVSDLRRSAMKAFAMARCGSSFARKSRRATKNIWSRSGATSRSTRRTFRKPSTRFWRVAAVCSDSAAGSQCDLRVPSLSLECW